MIDWVGQTSTWKVTDTTDGGDRTENDYDWPNIQQVFTEVPVHIKHVFTGIPDILNVFSSE